MTAEEERIFPREKTKAQEEPIQGPQELVNRLQEQVKQFLKRLGKDSQKSSLPPSSDRFARQKKTRSLRKASGKKAGGQTGHWGVTLTMSETPDEVRALPVSHCRHGQADLSGIAASSVERRQVVDVPEPRVQLTASRAEGTPCPHGHADTRAAFPRGVSAAVHQGPRVGTIAVYLLIQQRLP
ncbi:MAG TPA: DUF6444 domain-containing protein [Ktedonobacteraceae bacterium]|jgi:transposase